MSSRLTKLLAFLDSGLRTPARYLGPPSPPKGFCEEVVISNLFALPLTFNCLVTIIVKGAR